MEYDESWSNLKWLVRVYHLGWPLERYRQHNVLLNTHTSFQLCVEVFYLDLYLKFLRDFYKELHENLYKQAFEVAKVININGFYTMSTV